jgi:hypothetical protein
MNQALVCDRCCHCEATYNIPHDGYGDPPLLIEPIRETTPETLIHDRLELNALGFSGLMRRTQRRARDQVVGTGGVQPSVLVNVESSLLRCVRNHKTAHLSHRR